MTEAPCLVGRDDSRSQRGFDAFCDAEWPQLVRFAFALTGRMDAAADRRAVRRDV